MVQVAHNEDLIYTSERRRALSLLCKLAKSARVFPRCYELKGIEYDSEPVDGGGFAEVHKGKYRDEKICLKIVRVYQKQQSDEILRVSPYFSRVCSLANSCILGHHSRLTCRNWHYGRICGIRIYCLFMVFIFSVP